MSNDETSVDAGLEELTSDILGPAPNAEVSSAESGEIEASADQGTVEEQVEPEAQDQASAVAPTPAAAPSDTVEINGKQYTREQLGAMATTASQFGHLQRLYTELKQKQDAPPAAPQQAQVTAPQMRAQIRASFDEGVKRAVADGFLEEDFSILYPDAAANMIMYRDSLLTTIGVVKAMSDEIQQYKSQQTASRVQTEVMNNMVSLSQSNPALAALGDQAERERFFQYLVALDPRMDQLQNPDFYTAQWVAMNGNKYLSGAELSQAKAQAAATARADAKRRASGAALPGSRPAATPAAPRSVHAALDEMADDFLNR